METINKPDEELFKDLYEKELEFMEHETPERPTDINYRLRNESYTANYDDESVSEEFDDESVSEEFLEIYKTIRDSCISDDVRRIMTFYLDSTGRQLLTDEEISMITGFNILKVKHLKGALFGIIERNEAARKYYEKTIGKRKTTKM